MRLLEPEPPTYCFLRLSSSYIPFEDAHNHLQILPFAVAPSGVLSSAVPSCLGRAISRQRLRFGVGEEAFAGRRFRFFRALASDPTLRLAVRLNNPVKNLAKDAVFL